MERLIQKTSTILISTGDLIETYRSPEEVPPALRQQLSDALNGENAGTILIADERGQQEILRSMRGLPSAVDSRLLGPVRRNSHVRRWPVRLTVELMLLGGICVCLWLLAAAR